MNTDDPAAARHQIASRIHDLLRRETGQEIDTALMLGPPEYARAVLSLCRACGHAELALLADDRVEASSLSVSSSRPSAFFPKFLRFG